MLITLSSAARPLVGDLFVLRDPEVTRSKGGIYFPDDTGANSWAVDRLSCAGICLMHTSTLECPDLTGKRVFFEKWAEREFTLDGVTINVLRERAILAYEERTMTLKEVLADIEAALAAEHEGDLDTDALADLRVDINDHMGSLIDSEAEADVEEDSEAERAEDIEEVK